MSDTEIRFVLDNRDHFRSAWVLWMDTLAKCGLSYTWERDEGVLRQNERIFRGPTLFHCLDQYLAGKGEANQTDSELIPPRNDDSQ